MICCVFVQLDPKEVLIESFSTSQEVFGQLEFSRTLTIQWLHDEVKSSWTLLANFDHSYQMTWQTHLLLNFTNWILDKNTKGRFYFKIICCVLVQLDPKEVHTDWIFAPFRLGLYYIYLISYIYLASVSRQKFLNVVIGQQTNAD